jgi:hypothetical protein
MTTTSRIWFGVFVVLVFFTGAFAGVMADRLWLLRGGAPFVRGERIAEGRPGSRMGYTLPVPMLRGGLAPLTARLTSQLDLTEAQQKQVRELLDRWADRAPALQYELQRNFKLEQDRLRSEIEALLTDEQRAKFRELPPDLVRRPGRGGPRRGGGGRD